MQKAPPLSYKRARGKNPRRFPALWRPCFFSRSIKLFGLLSRCIACLAALLAKMPAFNDHTQQNTYYRKFAT